MELNKLLHLDLLLLWLCVLTSCIRQAQEDHEPVQSVPAVFENTSCSWNACASSTAASGNPDLAPCNYGRLPGHWILGGPHNLTSWQSDDPRCQLRDLATDASFSLENYSKDQSSLGGERQLGILLLGDSNDRRLVSLVCRTAGCAEQSFDIQLDDSKSNSSKLVKTCNRNDSGDYKDITNCNTCSLPRVRLTREAIWGFSSGPFHEGRLGSAKERTSQGLALFSEEHGRPPDLIVIQSALWDLASLWRIDTQDGKQPAKLLAGESLPPDWMAAWEDGVSEVLKQLKEAFRQSNTLLAWRTTAFPQLRIENARGGWHKFEKLGQRSHLMQLNSAARKLAESHGLSIIDVEAMTAGFPMPGHYLEDSHHHKEFLDASLVNIYLNMLLQRNRGEC